MTRRLFECPYCKERFSSTEALQKHSQMHLSEQDEDPLSNMSSGKEGSSEYNHTKENVDLQKEHPDIFKKTVRVCLERVDTRECPMEHAGEINKKSSTTGSVLNGSEQMDSKKYKRGRH